MPWRRDGPTCALASRASRRSPFDLLGSARLLPSRAIRHRRLLSPRLAVNLAVEHGASGPAGRSSSGWWVRWRPKRPNQTMVSSLTRRGYYPCS